MNITTVSYSELISGDNYSNRTIGATATVDSGDDPDVALSALRAWVQERHAGITQESVEEGQLVLRRSALTLEVFSLNERVAELKERYERAKAFLARCGIPVPNKWYDEVPF